MPKAAKIRKLNLNNFEHCDESEITDGGLIIIPHADGNFQPPTMYLNRVDDPDAVVDTEDAVWSKSVKISQRGTREEYNQRVQWWFDNAAQDAVYKAEINAIYDNAIKAGLSVQGEILKAKNWLETCSGGQRKVNVNSFVTRWLNKSANRVLNSKRSWR